MANKKAQAMVVDLILLILICSIFFLFMSNHVGKQAIETGKIRSQSAYTQKLLISTLNYRISGGEYSGIAVAELIGMGLCNEEDYHDLINSSVHEAIIGLNKQDYHFIFVYGNTASEAVYDYLPCVKTPGINLASAEMEFSCNNATISLGIWPASMGVESCE